MCRGRAAWLFLGLLALGVLWPVVAGAVSCGARDGDCCAKQPNACGISMTGFSLCCFHSASTFPDLPPLSVEPIQGPGLAAVDETGGPPPDPRGILHVPKSWLPWYRLVL